MNLEHEHEPDITEKIAKNLGIFFLASSAGVMLVLLVTFIQFQSEPESILSVQWFFEFLQSDAAVATVTVEGREAIVDIDPDLRRILLLFVGAVSVLALGSMLHACVGGGLALVRFANGKSAHKS